MISVRTKSNSSINTFIGLDDALIWGKNSIVNIDDRLSLNTTCLTVKKQQKKEKKTSLLLILRHHIEITCAMMVKKSFSSH
jgi:hypothetical protein